MKLLKSISNFAVGLVDSFGRGKEPDGSFADSKNLIPTNIGSLETVHGYDSASLSSHVAAVYLPPTGFPQATGGTAISTEKFVADPFPFSSRSPIAYDGRIYWVTDTAAAKHIMLDTWFKDSTTKQTNSVSGFVLFDERKTLAYSADIAMASDDVHTITISNIGTKGLAATGYYNSWRAEWYDSSTGGTKYAYIVNAVVGVSTATLTILEDINSLGWTAWASGDTLTFRRWFHSKANFIPDFDTPPGQSFVTEGVVRGCGGASSDENKQPWWCGYVDRNYFNGVDGGTGVRYQGTYVDVMETANSAVNIISPLCETNAALYVPAGTYEVAFSLEYDGYQESELVKSSSSVVANGSTDFLTTALEIDFAQLSKRVTAVNLYARATVSGVTEQFYFIRRIALYDLTATEYNQWDYQPVDSPEAGAHTVAGYFVVSGFGAIHPLAYITGNDWDNRGGSYYDRNGRVERDFLASFTPRNIVSWQYTETVSGRRFYGDFYDWTIADYVTGWVRFTPFSQGVPSFDIIPWDRLSYEFEGPTSDPSPINGMKSGKGFLYTFKSNSIKSSFINDTPETWVHNDLTTVDGLASPKSLIALPSGDICFADIDHYKMISNQRIIPLTTGMKNTYYTLTGKSSIISWYDKIDDAVCFTNGVDTTYGVHYRGYQSSNGLAWYKVAVPIAHYPEFVYMSRDNTIYFTNNHVSGFQGFFKWNRLVYTFGGGYIIPYFKTNDIILDESVHILLDKIVVTKSGNGAAGTLENKVYVDTALSQDFTSEDKSAETLYDKLRMTSVRQGRRVQYEYNCNASGEYSTTEKLVLHKIDIYGVAIEPPEKSV